MQKRNFPGNLKYNQDYSWVKIENDIAVIGIVETPNENEFVFIKLPEKNKKIKKGDVYVSVEAIKWSGHLTSPITGEIIEVNDELFNEPAKINQNPYEEWIIKVKLDNKKEIDELKSSNEIQKYYEEQEE